MAKGARKKPALVTEKPAVTTQFGIIQATALLPEGESVPVIRHSGHLVEQINKYSLEKQLSLFDLLPEERKEILKKADITTPGLELSVRFSRMKAAFYQLIHEKSENKDHHKDGYYSGNLVTPPVEIDSGVKVQRAAIKCSYPELYRAFLGTNAYTGKQMKEVDSILEEFAKAQFWIKYSFTHTPLNGPKSKRKEDRYSEIEELAPLFKLQRGFDDFTEKEVKEYRSGNRARRGYLKLVFHPIFTHDIRTKYTEVPGNFNQLMIEAAGGNHKNVTEAVTYLFEWLNQLRGAGHASNELIEEKLVELLRLTTLVKEGRKKRVQDRIEHALQTMLTLGILDAWEYKRRSNNPGYKYVFKINLKWPRQAKALRGPTPK